MHPVLQALPRGSAQLADKEVEELVNMSSEDVGQWIPRLDGVLVGPGLGRDPAIIGQLALPEYDVDLSYDASIDCCDADAPGTQPQRRAAASSSRQQNKRSRCCSTPTAYTSSRARWPRAR